MGINWKRIKIKGVYAALSIALAYSAFAAGRKEQARTNPSYTANSNSSAYDFNMNVEFPSAVRPCIEQPGNSLVKFYQSNGFLSAISLYPARDGRPASRPYAVITRSIGPQGTKYSMAFDCAYESGAPNTFSIENPGTPEAKDYLEALFRAVEQSRNGTATNMSNQKHENKR